MQVKITDLKKSYNKHLVLKNINMELTKPGIYLIAGPNGSGKTTLLEIIIGLRKPTSGEVLINNSTPDTLESKRTIGFLSQQNSLRRSCYVHEELKLVSEIYSIKNVNLPEYLSKYNLDEYYRYKTGKLSGGYRRRLLLAMTLLPMQEIIVLDEPVSGLDPFSRNEIWNMITEVSRDRIVIVSDHYLNQAAQYSDYVYLLDSGNVVLHGGIKDVNSFLKKPLVVKGRKNNHESIENRLRYLGIEIDLKVSGTVYSYYINETDKQKLKDLDIKDCNLNSVDFEDIYFYYTGKYSHDGSEENG